MKRRVKHRSVKSHRVDYRRTPVLLGRYIIITLGIVIFLVVVKLLTTPTVPKGSYLGASSFLAKEGSESGGGSSSGESSGGGSSGGSSSGGSSSGGSSNTGPTATPKPETKTETEQKVTPTKTLVPPIKVERVKAEQENERAKENIRVRFEFEDGKLSLKQESSEAAEIKASKKIENEVETELEQEGLEIEEATGGGTLVRHNNVEAETSFPLSLNVATHTLVVTTPSGTREVTVLPDSAVKNLIEKGVVDEVNAHVDLQEQKGQPVFIVEGIKRKRFLGLILLSFNKHITVSAQNSDMLRQSEAILDRLLETLSF